MFDEFVNEHLAVNYFTRLASSYLQVFWTRETLDKFAVVGEKGGAVSTESLRQQARVRCLPEKPGERHNITIMFGG